MQRVARIYMAGPLGFSGAGRPDAVRAMPPGQDRRDAWGRLNQAIARNTVTRNPLGSSTRCSIGHAADIH
jgi:hypothetical protein